MQPKDRRLVTELKLESHTRTEIAPVRATAQSASSLASQALSTAQGADTKSDNTVIRVEHIETLAGLAPGEVTDAQTANLLLQPGSSTRDAFGETLANEVSTFGSAGQAALDVLYARQVTIDANKHGVVADGVTDDAPAWNAIVAAAQPGDVITWTGTSMLDNYIAWKSDVSLVGQGWGKSVLATRDTTGSRYFSAIDFTPMTTNVSAENPLENVTFANFEVDGSGLTGTNFNIGGKALFGQFIRRSQFINLYLHDTVATALGVDYLPDCLIHGVVTVNAGRNWAVSGGGGGGAGIGIGTGGWEEESLTISDCHTISTDPARPAHWGIFVEYQAGMPYKGRGIRITGCSATGADVGIGDRGTAGTLITGCTVYRNRVGMLASMGAEDGLVSGNIAYENTADGYQFESSVGGRYSWRGNKSYRNGRNGIRGNVAENTIPGITIEGNESYLNGESGYYLSGISGKLVDFVFRNNSAHNNNQSESTAAAANRGIRFDTTLERFDVSHNTAADSQTNKTQTVGLSLGNGVAFLDGQVKANVLSGNGDGTPASALGLGSSPKTNVVVDGNVGAPDTTSGTAVIRNGDTRVTFPHGLVGIPSNVQVTANTEATVWIVSKGSGNIIIGRTGTSGDVPVDWIARL